MIISTSSHNVRLTEGICDFVEEIVRDRFSDATDCVTSVDVRLEISPGTADQEVMIAVVRADLNDAQTVFVECRDSSFYAAIRHSATRAAREADLHSRSDGAIRHRQAGINPELTRQPATNI